MAGNAVNLSSSLLAFIAFLFIPALSVQAATERFTVVTPPDRSVVEGGLISVVLTQPKGGLEEARASVNGRDYPFKISTGGKYACLEGVKLDRGMNLLRIVLLKGREIIGERNLTVFFRSDLSAKASNAPHEYKRFVFHLPENEKTCAPCHPMKVSRVDENPSTPRQSSCFTCHKKITAGKFVHSPAGEWSCVTCHNGKSKKGGSALAADGKSCSICHSDQLAKWNKKEFRHGPADAGHCIACHDPHASDHPSFLHANATEICVTCHEEIMAKPHVTASMSANGGHPVKISPDPYRPGRDFTCASCHNPHAGDAPNFLNNYKASMSIHRFCLSCHRL